MAVVWLSGFETGLGSANGGGLVLSSPAGANASIVTTAGRVKSGTYATRLNPPSGQPGCRGLAPNLATSSANGGFWLYLEALPAGDVQLFTVQGSTTEDCVIQYDQGTGKLAGFDPTNGQIGIFNSCPVLSADTFYWIAWEVDRSANTLSITITPDGGSATDCGSVTGATGWTANNGWVAIGNDSAQTNAFDAYYDDVIVCTGTAEYPLAPHEVLGLQPGADGSHNVAGTEYAIGDTGTTNYTNASTDANTQLIKSLPWTTTRSTTANISCEVHSAGTYLEIAPATAASGKPNATAVRAILAYSSVTGTANNGSATVVRNSGGSETTIRGNFTTGADYSETSNFYNGAMVTSPGGGWTKTEIEAIRWRIGRASNSSDISPRPTWQGLFLEIAYEIPGGTSETPTPGGATAGGFGPTVKVAVPQGGAVAGGVAPTEGGGGTSETPTPGGATAGGFAPVPRVAVPQGGATAQGLAPAPRTALTIGGAVAAGATPLPRVSVTQGGAQAGGFGATVRVAVPQGGAVAGGVAPSDGAAVEETPTPGGAVAGGFSPSVRVSTAQGGASAAGLAPAPRATLTIQGAPAGGFGAAVRVALAAGGAVAGGQLDDPLGVKLSPFGPPSPSRSGAAAGTPQEASYGRPSPSGGIVRGSPSRRDPNA